jgi:hypothetical protein
MSPQIDWKRVTSDKTPASKRSTDRCTIDEVGHVTFCTQRAMACKYALAVGPVRVTDSVRVARGEEMYKKRARRR